MAEPVQEEKEFLIEFGRFREENQRQHAELAVRIEQVNTEVSSRVEQVNTEVSTRIEQVDGGLRAELRATESRLIKWMVGLILGLAATMLATGSAAFFYLVSRLPD